MLCNVAQRYPLWRVASRPEFAEALRDRGSALVASAPRPSRAPLRGSLRSAVPGRP
jgi:hypothetical protein